MGVNGGCPARQYEGVRRDALSRISGLYKEFNHFCRDYGAGAAEGSVFHRYAHYGIASSSQDGLLGALIMDSLLTPVFSLAANDCGFSAMQGGNGDPFTLQNMSRMSSLVDEYYRDRSCYTDTRLYKKGAGKGTQALLHGPERARPVFAFQAANDAAAPRLEKMEQALARAVRDLERAEIAMR